MPLAFLLGFESVARETHGLVILLVPEEGLVAAVRDDVVDDLRRRHAPPTLTLLAERMLDQELRGVLLPSVVVAALVRGPSDYAALARRPVSLRCFWHVCTDLECLKSRGSAGADQCRFREFRSTGRLARSGADVYTGKASHSQRPIGASDERQE